MTTLTVSKAKVEKQKGVVILPLRDYQKLLERAVPTFYLKGKEAKKLDRLVAEGLKEYERGETVAAKSLKEALAIYERRQNKKR